MTSTEEVYLNWGRESAVKWLALRTEPSYMCLGTWTLYEEGEPELEIVRHCKVDQTLSSLKVAYSDTSIIWRSSRLDGGLWIMERDDFSEAYIKSMVVSVCEFFYSQVFAYPGQPPMWEHTLLLMGFHYESTEDLTPTDFNS